MFLKGLNETQQKLFLGIARELIEADDKISDNERTLINNLSAEMGQQELIRNPSDEVIRDFFPDKASRVATMLELIGLSACDGDFSAEEDKIITRLKNIFEMTDGQLETYRGWVKKLFEVQAEAAEFFN